MTDKTWTRKVIVVIICIAIAYGLWFNYLDSLTGVGQLFGGNLIYQPWNIVGHLIPGLFLLLVYPNRIEIFFAAFLISTVTMDSPMWGIERLYLHHGFLWTQHGNTYVLSSWIAFYYNPIGLYGIWGSAFPTSSIMFLSIVVRLALAVWLIWYQNRLELSLNRQVPLKSIIARLDRGVGRSFEASSKGSTR